MNNNKTEIMVSIICNTYNHQEFIRDALEGFVSQKTNFPFEVLIHDDASTDGTAEIIREYEEKYPTLIKPIYQMNNQYSKGVGISDTFQLPRVKGKYIAVCEGDDCWIDDHKLQKQVDILESNDQIDICTHCVKRINSITGQEDYIAPCKESKLIPVEKVILGGGGFVGTNSIMYRASLIHNLPRFRTYYPLDYTLQVHGALRGGMYYLSDIMSIYRFLNTASWTKKNRKNLEKAHYHYNKWIEMLKILNDDTEHKYDKEIQMLLLSDGISLLNTRKENYKILKKYNSSFNLLSNKMKIKLLLITYVPAIAKLMKRIRIRKAYE